MKKKYFKIIPILGLTMILQSCKNENITNVNKDSLEIANELNFEKEDEKLQIGAEINGFKVENIQKATSINADAITFKHMKTGAEVVWLKNDDTQLQVYTLFKSKAEDNKGIPHVFEHAMFGGSEKYPTTGATATIFNMDADINAMAYLSFTAYAAKPYTTESMKGILDFWFQTAFYPNEKFLEQSLKRDGYRLVMNSPQDELTITGAVYNEFKSPNIERDILSEINSTLFPDTAGRFNLGTVDGTLQLTTNDLEEFRKKYFVPSNNLTVLYGDLEYMSLFSYLDEIYSQFDKVDVDTKFELQPPFEQQLTKEIKMTTPYKDDLYTYNIASNKIGDEYYDTAMLALSQILSQYKVFSEKSIEKFGADVGVISYTDALSQPQNVVSFRATKNNQLNIQQFKDGINEILAQIVQEGIDKDFLNSFLDSKILESYRNNSIIRSAFIDYVLYGTPVKAFNKFEIYEDFKSKIDDNFFENFINDFILNNNHVALITIVYDPNQIIEETNRRDEQILQYKNSLTKEQIDEIVKQNQQFNEMQEKYNDSSMVSNVINLKYEDVKKLDVNMKDFVEKKLDGNITFLKTNNPIVSETMSGFVYFDASAVDYEDSPYVLLLTTMLGTSNFDTYTLNSRQNENEQRKYLLSFGYDAINTNIKNNEFKPYFKIRFDSNLKNFEDATLYINDIIKNMKIDKNYIENNLENITISANDQYYINQEIQNLIKTTVNFKLTKSDKFAADVQDKYMEMLSNIDIDIAVQKLSEISSQIFTKNNATVILSGDINNSNFNEDLVENIFKDLSEFPTNDYYAYYQNTQLTNESIYIPTNDGQDNYVQILPKIFDDYKKMAMFDLAIKIIHKDFNEEIRGKNGAYAPIITRHGFYGIIAGALMDPDFTKTRQTVLNLPQKIDNIRNMSDEDFKKAQASAAFEYIKNNSPIDDAKVDIEQSLSDQIENFYFSGFEKQDLKNMFESIFEFTKEDIANLSQEFQQMLDKSTISLFTSEKKIQDNADILN